MAVSFELGALRRALPAVLFCYFCVLPACGSGPVHGRADGAGDLGPGDSAVEHVAPDSADAAIDTLVAGPDAGADARDVASDAPDAPDAPDASDAGRDVRPDVVDASVEATPDVGNPCLVDCTHLPHVRPGAVSGCNAAGICVVPFGSCEAGFDHCSSNPNDGCEADRSTNATCGSCFTSCYPPSLTCVSQAGGHSCARISASPFPVNCQG